MKWEERIALINDQIQTAAGKAGRNPEGIALMAVSKTRSADEIRAAVTAGLLLFGENRVQEVAAKGAAYPEVHMIGSLQSNKAAQAVSLFDSIDSVDRLKLVPLLNREAAKFGKILPVMIQINSSGEESKHGVACWDDLAPILEAVSLAASLELSGLMTIGPLSGGEGEIRNAFSLTRTLFEKAVASFPFSPFPRLSMGMSGDFSLAIEEGSTLVRIGTALFGARDGQ